jgi:3-deoxy-D-manno-octulosonic-acid transferase
LLSKSANGFISNLKIFPKKISSNQNFYFQKKIIVLGSSYRGEEKINLKDFSCLKSEGKRNFSNNSSP